MVPVESMLPHPLKFIENYRQAMREVLCCSQAFDEELETVSSRLTSRQASRASSIVKIRKVSSARSNPGEAIRLNPRPRKNSQDQSTDL